MASNSGIASWAAAFRAADAALIRWGQAYERASRRVGRWGRAMAAIERLRETGDARAALLARLLARLMAIGRLVDQVCSDRITRLVVNATADLRAPPEPRRAVTCLHTSGSPHSLRPSSEIGKRIEKRSNDVHLIFPSLFARPAGERRAA